jgi:starch synthase
MKVVLSAPGKFHVFDLARELHARRALTSIFTGYPHFKLKNEGLPKQHIRSWPWLQSAYMAMPGRDRLGTKVVREWEWRIKVNLDRYVAGHMPDCDVFVGLSGSALQSGLKVRARGGKYVCDRGSAHIRTQNELLCEEADRWGVPYEGIDPRVIDREEAEYAEADCITVPSLFSLQSFVQRGVPQRKLKVLSYGVNLDTFKPVGKPDVDRFDVLYVGGMNLNKGIPYLLMAYRSLMHPRKSLTLAGAPSEALMARMKALGLWSDDIRVLGHVPQGDLKGLMSRSHVMVLPSVQDGFGMVLSQAMACGCVVIGTEHTGAVDIVTPGEDGYVVPARDADSLAAAMQTLADDPDKRAALGANALRKVAGMGGWSAYGSQACELYAALMGGH